MFIRAVKVQALFFLFLTNCYASDQLPSIVIQSTIFKNQSVDDFAQSATIISDNDLARKKSNSIGEIVNQELGVSSTYFAPGVSRPIIRGLGSNRVRVLENGVDSLDVSSVSEDHAVSIEPYIAKQVEILRGPATLRYGPGAIGGVVNVVNKRLPQTLEVNELELDIHAEHASVSDGSTAAIDLNGAHKSIAWHVDGLTRDTNDYEINGFANEANASNRGVLKNSDVETDSFGLGASYINNNGMVGLAFSKLDSNYGIPAAEEGDIRIDLKQYRYDSQVELYQPISGIDSISLRSSFNNYRHFEIEENGEIATIFDNEALETRLEFLTNNYEGWKNAFGIQYNDKEFSALGEEAFIQPVEEQKYGVYAVTGYQTDMWDIEVGGRFDRNEYKPDVASNEQFSVISLSMGVIRDLSEDLKFSVYAARSERAPQEVALYANGPHLATLTFERGSEDVMKETSYSLEIGLGQKKDQYSWQVNAYYNQIDDFIYLAMIDENNDGISDRSNEEGEFEIDGEFLSGRYTNEDAKFYGIEAQATHRVFEDESVVIDGRVFADYVRAKFRDNDVGNVPRIAPARFGVGLDANRGQWSTNLDLTYVSEQTKTAQLETSTNGSTMLNANISKTIYVEDTDMKFFLRANNLLDKGARQHASIQKDRITLPGRSFLVGLSLSY
jgi:iron complex outermembrane receptor protein